MWVPIVTKEGNIGAGKTTLLQNIWTVPIWWRKGNNQSRTWTCKRVSEFYGNNLINPPEHFYKNPDSNAFIFQNYVLDFYEQRMDTLETAQHLCKVIVMDCGVDAFQILTTVNRDQYTKFGFLYLTEKYINQNSFQANFMLQMESFI